MTIKKTITVGLHPNALAENPVNGYIYVANSDSDTISVVDPTESQVVQTISLAPYKGAPKGSQPDGLTVSPDGKTLYIANSDNNDIAVVDLGEANTKEPSEPKIKGLIPTAWYPTGVFVSGDTLMYLNMKGLGTGPHLDQTPVSQLMKSSLYFVDIPDSKQLKKYTRKVEENNTIQNPEGEGWLNRLKGDSEFPIPRFANQKSPIKHVIYVLKENRTYDEIFGDLGKGNGDSGANLFGKDITPNLHKMANQFVTLDNFYVDADASPQGHNWSTASKANDFVEKNWLPNYSGRRGGDDFEGSLSASYPEAGFIWDSARRAGVSFRDYGEFVNYDKTKGWYPKDPTTIGSANVDPLYQGWNLDYSDVDRVNEWAREYNQFEQNRNLPQFELVRLPNDHTYGTVPGKWTPQAMMAQNDYALGKLVNIVSHSKDWKDTAIFVIEDDAQAGVDHVDAHRTEVNRLHLTGQ